MARDYARNRSGGGKKKRNTRSRPAAKRRNDGPPGWVWLVCGVCLGLVVAAGVYVFGRAGGMSGLTITTVDSDNPPAERRPAGKDGGGDKKSEPRFAFYEMLPNYEVVIPEEEYENGDSDGATAKTSPKVRQPGRYRIQAGSFSEYADADRRKAELALLGLESEIQSVKLDDGRTVYRVRSGPVEELERLNGILKRLRENDIDTLVMRAREE
ncbi:hypothetical protein PC39_13112 [Salinisphaera sp. PC39]|uniref:SPOR domain-containing protein n=1 Tax=Salinisphaera sp. PC39 TaxID=1304156 RepID=UPI0033424874